MPRRLGGPAHAPAFRAKLLKQLDKVGITGVEKRIRFEKVVTPADWESRYHVYRGATFNLAHTWGQMLHLRPRNRFDELDGVYLVGGGTHPGSGLPVIYESARITSRLLLEDLGCDAEWLGVPGAAECLSGGSLSPRATATEFGYVGGDREPRSGVRPPALGESRPPESQIQSASRLRPCLRILP